MKESHVLPMWSNDDYGMKMQNSATDIETRDFFMALHMELDLRGLLSWRNGTAARFLTSTPSAQVKLPLEYASQG